MESETTLILIGGANGSGKTTLAREYISVENLPYLGADQIAFELNPENVESVAIEAGRLFIQKIVETIEKKESFILESTLSGLTLRKWITKASEAGYFVKLAFVYLDSPQLCIERIAARVKRGGHHVPDEDIVRRYRRSNQNFWFHYKDLADEWKLFHNVDSTMIPVATGDKNGVMIANDERYSLWLEMVTKTETEPKKTDRA